MPHLNRRRFLHLLSAAGMAPLLPALAPNAVASAAHASTSKALWAGLYANSGSASKFVRVARNMGLSNATIQGVGARSVGVKLAVSAAMHAPPQPTSRPDLLKTTRKALADLKETLDKASLDDGADDTAHDGDAPQATSQTRSLPQDPPGA